MDQANEKHFIWIGVIHRYLILGGCRNVLVAGLMAALVKMSLSVDYAIIIGLVLGFSLYCLQVMSCGLRLRIRRVAIAYLFMLVSSRLVLGQVASQGLIAIFTAQLSLSMCGATITYLLLKGRRQNARQGIADTK